MPRRSEEGISFSGTGVTGSCELPDVGAGNQLGPFGRAAPFLRLLSSAFKPCNGKCGAFGSYPVRLKHQTLQLMGSVPPRAGLRTLSPSILTSLPLLEYAHHTPTLGPHVCPSYAQFLLFLVVSSLTTQFKNLQASQHTLASLPAPVFTAALVTV